MWTTFQIRYTCVHGHRPTLAACPFCSAPARTSPIYRSTAFGLLTALSRVASIVSIYTFGSFQSTNPAAPILIVAIFMITGGAFSLLLPLSKDPARQSLLGKALRPYVDKLLAIRLMPCPDRQETLSQSDVTARRRN